MGCASSQASAGSAPLSKLEISKRIDGAKQTESIKLSGRIIKYAWLSQRGYYPDAPNKDNQDSYSVITNFGGASDQAFFAVYDGHGKDGHLCARFARDQVINIYIF